MKGLFRRWGRHSLGALVAVALQPSAALAQAQVAVIHTFPAAVPTLPSSAIQTGDGNFYGLGGDSVSMVYRLTPAGDLSVVRAFTSSLFEFPSGLILGADHTFYGTTRPSFDVDGTTHAHGTIFSLTAAGEFTLLRTMSGLFSAEALMQASDGNLYGAATDPVLNASIFRLTPAGVVTTLHGFASGELPRSPLVEGTDDALYGTMGSASGEVFFRLGLDGSYSVLDTFVTIGAPTALLLAGDGNFYGTTVFGSRGTIFRITPAGVYTLLQSFDASTGEGPSSLLIQGADGDFYGVSSAPSFGRIFKMSSAGVVTTVYTFTEAVAVKSLRVGTGGVISGAFSSSSLPAGGIFSLNGTTFTVLHAFPRAFPYGAVPRGGLVQAGDGDGTLYGVAAGGDGSGDGFGVLYKTTTAGAFAVAHTFSGAEPDGYAPEHLTVAHDGALIGTGGTPPPADPGRVVRITTSDSVSLLHKFGGMGGGWHPNSAVVEGPDGAFYGTTVGYLPPLFPVGAEGIAYRVDAAGSFSALHVFQGSDGAMPAGLVAGTDGNLYGVTPFGGAHGDGRLFRMTPAGAVTALHDFTNEEGIGPQDPLIQGADGSLYGVTRGGGAAHVGTVFKSTLDGVLTVLHSFTAAEGAPSGPLLQCSDGRLLGVTATGGASGRGAVYAISPAGAFSEVYVFTGGNDGRKPLGPLLQAADGMVYGVEGGSGLGADPTGAVFRLQQPPMILTAPPPGVLRVADGQPVQLTATATGLPVPSVQWQVSIDGGATFTAIAGATGPTYVFTATPSLNGAQYRALFVSAAGSAATIPVTLILPRPGAPPEPTDLDGDGRAELMVWRASNGTWFSLRSSTGYDYASAASKQWGSGNAGDIPLVGDLDGDGIADLVVWRATTGMWFWLTSTSGYDYAAAGSKQWGSEGLGDVPMLGDVDGDGRADLIVWRASTGTWFWLTSRSGYAYAAARSRQWGNATLGDQPLLADFDGDGLDDLAVWRAGTGVWYWLTSSTGYDYSAAGSRQWGSQAGGDVPLVGDLDGDTRADLVVWRASTGTWFWLLSSAGYAEASQGQRQWGNAALGDIPRLPDLDGDGKADLTVWRASTGTWFWLTSASGYDYAAARSKQWGSQPSGDIPMSR